MQDLCTVARRQMVFFDLCPNDDWRRDPINEVSSTLSEILVVALTKLIQQDELKQQSCVKENNSLNVPNHLNPTARNNNFNPQQRCS